MNLLAHGLRLLRWVELQGQLLFRRDLACFRRRHFLRRLQYLLNRSQDTADEFGLMLVELTNIRQIEREWGRATALACTAYVAQRLRGMATPGDELGCLRVSRLALFSWRPCSQAAWAELGLNMIACGLADHWAKPPGVSIRVRVVAATLTRQGACARRMVDHLEHVQRYQRHQLQLIRRPFAAQHETSVSSGRAGLYLPQAESEWRLQELDARSTQQRASAYQRQTDQGGRVVVVNA